MLPAEFCALAARLMRHPAAPYQEDAVRGEVERICAEHGIRARRDRAGNLIVHLQTDAKVRPIALAAHLDHPGFEIVRPLSRTRWLARFLGGVPDAYFRPGVLLRLLPEARAARLGKRRPDRFFEINTASPPVTGPRFAVWELDDFAIRRNHIHGRACDDLIGVASILATLIDLKRARARTNVIGVISRAEEVGFQGALMAATSRALPKNALVISLETSRELPGVKMGGGVILRVGDRASIFDSAATRYLSEVGAALRKRRPDFQVQRALMSGGTCEATAYQEFGFQTAAVCVALGNYHNCGPRNRIAAEYVSVSDACGMVDLLVAASRQMKQYPRLVAKLPARLNKLLREARAALK
jgi:putative aminopeptidase FrvX